MKLEINTLFYVVLPVLLGGIGFLFWQKRKDIFKFLKVLKIRTFPSRYNLVLSLDFNEGLNSGNYFDQIKKNLNDLMIQNGLSKQIRIIDYSDIFCFKNNDEAESFGREKNIDLIIWGGFSNDNLKVDGEVLNKINLKFTFGHPDDQKNLLGNMMKLDIGSKIARKNYWRILENDSYNDVAIISNNLFHISTYILALIFKLYGKIEKSLYIFENLHLELVNSEDDFNEIIIPHLLNCYEVLSIEYGLGKNNYEKGIEYSKKIYELNNKSFFAISNLAIFYYKNGNKPESDKFIQLLLKYYSGDPITIVDIAFIRILEKNYSNAFKQYKKIIAFKEINFNSIEVTDFLNKEYDRIKEPALLYGSGIISYYYGDREAGKDDLRLFLKRAKSKDYKSMQNKAQKLLK